MNNDLRLEINIQATTWDGLRLPPMSFIQTLPMGNLIETQMILQKETFELTLLRKDREIELLRNNPIRRWWHRRKK